MLVLNGANICNKFHETAQILASDQLLNNVNFCFLEVPCKKLNGNTGEIDILVDSKYVYEVKPKNESHKKAHDQISDYVNANKDLVYLEGKY